MGWFIPELHRGSMATEKAAMVRCTTCGTEFSTADAEAVQAHQGHPTEHIEQG
jgi:hypothetical protein